MQRPLGFRRVSDGEHIKRGGFLLDFDEIARSGKMSKEDAFIAKWYGIYDQRQAGNYMARIVLPGGVFTSAEARAMAAVAERYAMGRISFTTRQAAQLHWLKLGMLPAMLRDLAGAGLSTFHGCGDVTRNVTSCPWADVCPHKRFEVLPDAVATARALTEQRDLDDLPRKFKISFNGCGADCALPYMNDVGITAVSVRAGQALAYGYRVVIGGGHGWQSFVAKPLYGFVPASRIAAVCRAVALLFRDHGDRWNRATARLKYVVYKYGINRCRELVEAYLDAEGVDRSEITVASPVDEGPVPPRRPLTDDAVVGSDGKAIARVRILKGEIGFHSLIRLAELSEMYGDKHLRANHRQNLEIHGVASENVSALEREISALGFGTRGFFGLTDIVSCVGTTYCPLAVTRTHDMVAGLGSVTDGRYDAIRDRVQINVTGCPNACAPYRLADIGLRGARIREMTGSVEAYDIAIGGDQHRHGQSIGAYKAEDCPRVTGALLDTFASLVEGDESFAETVRRVGIHPFEDAVAGLGISYDMAPAPPSFSSPRDGRVRPLDQATIDKEIPCRAACPASTRVPWYIDRIAEGDPEGAYRINQEDNVFPGVLGRICTRPCEDACRHLWTGTRGAVTICHLKRAAADRKAAPPGPLPSWYGPTGRRVAVIGSGPSGLTAARELRRYGHQVVIYEREKALGGMMRLCIPHFRLPRPVLDEEIAAIIDSGVSVRTGVDVTFEQMRAMLDDGEYDAVLLAAGTITPRTLRLEGLPEGKAVGGLDLMRRYCLREPIAITPPVRIVGGGFTAIDCARAARRILGPAGGDISMYVRRTRDLMSAGAEELAQLAEEEIQVETLVSPVGVKMEGDKILSVALTRNVLGAAGADGRPQVRPLAGSRFEEPCGTLLFAIGQTQGVALSLAGVSMVDEVTTDKERLFVAGDFSTGSLDVIHAVASGKKAADAIDVRLMGAARRRPSLAVGDVVSGETGRLRDHDLQTQPEGEVLPPMERRMDDEVAQGFSADAAAASAKRCYLCHYKYEIDQDKCIQCDWCIKVSPRECIRRVSRLFTDRVGAVNGYVETAQPREGTFIWMDSDNCIRCGNCYRVCPVGAISVVRIDVGEVGCGAPHSAVRRAPFANGKDSREADQ